MNNFEPPMPASRRRYLVAAVLAALYSSSSGADAQERTEEIIVTSSIVEQPRRQIATAVSTIDLAEIELRGYQNLQEVLRVQPGVGVSNSGGSGKSTTVRIRGEEGYRTILLIDGIKTLDPSATQTTPTFDGLLATSDIQRVEILRGPQGFMYGADAGGVINVITARGEGPLGGRVSLEHGELGTTKVDANLMGGSDRSDYFLSLSDLETDGFNAQTGDTVLRDDDGASNTTLHTKLGWNATDKLRLQLVVRDIEAEAMYDGCFDPVTFSTAHDCRVATDQTLYRATAEQSGERFGNLFGYSAITSDSDNFSGNEPVFGSEGKIERIEYTGSFRASDTHTLAYGIDLLHEEAVGSTLTRQRDQDAYYFEYQGAYADRLFLSVGARSDDNDDFGSHTSTRVSAAYVQGLEGGRSLKYRASVGTGFRAPSLFEIGYNRRPFGVHPDALATPLVEEQSQGYDIGIDYTAADGARFEITYFDQEIEDQITYVSLGPPSFEDGYVQTPGVSRSEGIEVGVDWPVGERWAILGNWTRNDAKSATGAARLRRPENLGNVGLRYVSSSEVLRFFANYRISRDAIDFGNVRLDDYDVLDVSLTYVLNDVFDLYGRVQNATDEKYQEVAGFNTAPRTAYAGVRVRF